MAACRRTLGADTRLGRAPSPRGVARRSRTTANTPRSSPLARLAPRLSAGRGRRWNGFRQVVQGGGLCLDRARYPERRRAVWRRSQVVRRKSAKLLCTGSIPVAASACSASRGTTPLFTGANPVVASIHRVMGIRRGGGTGRRARLKILCPRGLVGSIPTPGTTTTWHVTRHTSDVTCDT